MAARDAYFPLIITFIIIDSIAVCLRFVARKSKGSVGYDDFAMLLSFVGFVLFGGMELTAIRYGIGATAMEPTFDAVSAAKYFTIAAVVYLLASGVSKVGVGLVLLRLSSSTEMCGVRWLLVSCIMLTAVWFLGGALVFAMQCEPLARAWNPTMPGTCMDSSVIGTAGIVISAGDVIFSIVFALLPIYMLRKVQIHLKLKLTVLVLLGLGLISAVMTIVRLKYVITVTKMSADGGIAGPNIINTTLEATIYSVLEIATSILAAALTALRPLVAKLPCFGSLGTNGKSSYPKHAKSSTTSRSRGGGGRVYPLSDVATTTDLSQNDSQEQIVRAPGAMIRRDTVFEIAYEARPDDARTQRAEW